MSLHPAESNTYLSRSAGRCLFRGGGLFGQRATRSCKLLECSARIALENGSAHVFSRLLRLLLLGRILGRCFGSSGLAFYLVVLGCAALGGLFGCRLCLGSFTIVGRS